MEKYLNILLIEDSEKHAKGIVSSYKRAVKEIEKKKLLEEYLGPRKVSIEWIKGTKREKRRNDTFWFYEDAVYSEIEKRIKSDKEKNICTGILLDISLSKEEYEKASVNDYSGFTMARKIYEQFDSEARKSDSEAQIYIVTSIREFSSQVLRLMGTQELAKRYVSKALVTEYPSYGVIARTIRYMYQRDTLDEIKEDEIDCLSDED